MTEEIITTENNQKLAIYCKTCICKEKCQRLKQQHNDDTEEIAKLGLDVAILEQENKELKEYSKRMENQRENYYKEYNNYRSALEKIKDLCNKGAGVYTNAKIVGIINEAFE